MKKRMVPLMTCIMMSVALAVEPVTVFSMETPDKNLANVAANETGSGKRTNDFIQENVAGQKVVSDESEVHIDGANRIQDDDTGVEGALSGGFLVDGATAVSEDSPVDGTTAIREDSHIGGTPSYNPQLNPAVNGILSQEYMNCNVGDTFSDVFGTYEILSVGQYPCVKLIANPRKDFEGNFWYSNDTSKPWTAVYQGVTYAVTEIACSLPGETVAVPEGITYIHDEVFLHSGAKHLILPSTLSRFDEKFGFSELIDITVSESNPNFKSDDNGILFSKDGSQIYLYPPCREGESYTSPDYVASVGVRAFINNNRLSSLTLTQVERISDYAFYGMKCIKNIFLPSTITDISYKYTFFLCNTLENIFVDDAENALLYDLDGVLFYRSGNINALLLYPASHPDKEYRIPYGVTRLVSLAFTQTQNTQTVYVPSTVHETYSYMFHETEIPMDIVLQYHSQKFMPDSSFDELARGSRIFVESNYVKDYLNPHMISRYGGLSGIYDEETPVIVDYEKAVCRFDNWYLKDGKKYYYDVDGKLVKGKYGYYFFGEDYSMQTGFQKWDGKIYYFNPEDGIQDWISGFLFVEDKRYIISKDGSICQEPSFDYGFCIYYLNTETGEIVCDSDSHIYGYWKDITFPTCTQDGLHSRTCKTCGFIDTTSVPKLPHLYSTWINLIESTCTSFGRSTHTCTICSFKEVIPDSLKPHTESKWEIIRQASCNTQGQRRTRCTVCGKIMRTSVVPQYRHSYGAWTIKKAATNSKDGLKTRFCSRCKFSQSQILPRLYRINITKASVSSIVQKTYTGMNINPTVKVKFGTKTLHRGTDYTTSFYNCKLPGKASVKLTGKGAYKGSKTIYFYIAPKVSVLYSLKSTKTGTLTLKIKKITGATGFQLTYADNKSFHRAKNISFTRQIKTFNGFLKKKTYYIKVRAYKKSGRKTIYGFYCKPQLLKMK